MSVTEVLVELDRLIAGSVVGDRPGLVVGLAARLAALGAGLTAPASTTGNGQADGEDRLLALPQVAEILGVPQDRAYDLARRRELPVVTIGRYKRVRASALRAFIGANEEKALDGMGYVTYSGRRDGRGGTANPKAPGAHPGPTRGTARGRREQRGAVGARGDGHPPDGRATLAAPGRGPKTEA